MHKVIGIDLGTTYSAVALYDEADTETHIVPDRNEKEGETTPSVVSYKEGETTSSDEREQKVIVGVEAKRQAESDPENTITEIKREMGEIFTEENIDRFKARGHFRPRERGEGGHEGDPVCVLFRGKWFRPQEISAFILMKMKEIAEAEIGEEVHDAVITVPAYFTARQNKATEEAALLAGLYPRRLLKEPTAAAICYGLDTYAERKQVYLVYDLGGGTFDVSIITAEENDLEVIATSGDPRLGGVDFDEAITEWAIQQLRTQHGIEVAGNPHHRALIKAAAEEAKVDLSSLATAKLPLSGLRSKEPPNLQLSRETFEGLIDGILNKSLSYVIKAIELADRKGTSQEEITAVLLVGGSSRIPLVKQKILDHFQKDEDFVKDNLDPDTVVARGAARVAMRLPPTQGEFDITRKLDASLKSVEVQDDDLGTIREITEHSLGVGIQQNLVDRLIDVGTNIPASFKKGGYTNPGPVENLHVHVYQGEGDYSYENDLIGIVELGPMEPKPEGHHKFDVTFALDRSGTLSVMVNHLNEQKTYHERFQSTAAVGSKGLAAMRNKLVRMYVGEPASAGPATPLPPLPGMSGAADAAAAVPQEPPAEHETSSTAGTGEVDAAGTVEIVPLPKEVPIELRGILRRSQKLLLKTPDPKLLEAFNNVSRALNEGVDEEELYDLQDDLENTYHDTRNAAS